MGYRKRKYHVKSVASLVEKAIGVAHLECGGSEILTECIYHVGDSQKLSINPDKGVFQCFVCGEKGTIECLLRDLKTKNMITQRDIVRVHKKLQFEPKPKPEPTLTECRLPEGATPIEEYREDYLGSLETGYEYLKKRGLSDDEILDYKVHLCPPGSIYTGRVVFPVYDSAHVLKSWMARSFWNKSPKMLNASAKYTPWSTSYTLFNEQRIVPGDFLAITEGPFDAIAANRLLPSVALQGKQLSTPQTNIITKRNPSGILVCLDGGEYEASVKIAKRLSTFFPVRIVNLKKGTDPDETPLYKLEAAFAAALSIADYMKLIT